MRRLIIPLIALLLVVAPGISSMARHGAPEAGAAAAWDPSGQAMPVGDPPGWHQVFADNFANDSYPLGSVTGCRLQGCSGTPNLPWGAVPDGHPDTSGNCQYYPSKTVSVTGGVMNIHLHTDPSGTCMGASIYPTTAPMTYGMYSVRFRSDTALGYKGVFLLWPVDHVSGEIDFPEANLENPLHGFLHAIAGGAQFQSVVSNASWNDWHTATLQWTPSSVNFILDGTSLGSTSQFVPQTPMTLTLRGESDLLGAPKPPSTSQGDLQVDWATVYSYVPGGPPTTTPTTTTTSPAPPSAGSHGYDMVGSDGGVFDFRGAFRGSLPGIGIHVNNVVGIVATNADSGYFLVGSDGGVFSFNAPFASSLPGIGIHVNDVVSLVPTLDDTGYFLVARDGGVFSFNARFLGSLPGIGVHVDDIVGIATTPDDGGYWLVGSDGSVYAFGNAHAYGNAPAGAVAITATHDGGGYWVVGSDGTVTALGDAGSYGSLPSLGVHVGNIVGMLVSPDSRGYDLLGRDGGVFTFGDAVDNGSLPGLGVHVNDIVGAIVN